MQSCASNAISGSRHNWNAYAEHVLRLLIDLELVRPWGAEQALPCQEDASLLTEQERAQALPLARLSRLISAEGLKRLRASRNLQERCRRLRHWHQTLPDKRNPMSEQDRLQLHLDLGADLPALIVQLDSSLQADWLERWRDPTDPLFHPNPPVDGTTLQRKLNLAPGPQLGALLRHPTGRASPSTMIVFSPTTVIRLLRSSSVTAGTDE